MGRIVDASTINKALIRANPHLCFYKMEGEYHVRLKSSLTAKRVATDPAFALTRVYSGIMGQASMLASGVLNTIPKALRRKRLSKDMVSLAMKALKAGESPAAIVIQLKRAFVPRGCPEAGTGTAIKPAQTRAARRKKHAWTLCNKGLPAGKGRWYVTPAGQLKTANFSVLYPSISYATITPPPGLKSRLLVTSSYIAPP